VTCLPQQFATDQGCGSGRGVPAEAVKTNYKRDLDYGLYTTFSERKERQLIFLFVLCSGVAVLSELFLAFSQLMERDSHTQTLHVNT
jgi:hypothetical protein